MYAATPDANPAIVNLSTAALQTDSIYTVTINRVLEQQAPQNAIWPNTKISFLSPVTDTDNDGVGNALDMDDDGDGVPDYIDAEPLNAANANEKILPVDGAYKGSGVKDETGTLSY